MLSYMLPVEEKPPSSPSNKGHMQLPLVGSETLTNGRTTSPISKETSVSSFISDVTTATASHSSMTPTSTSDKGKPKIIINGGKHQTLKRSGNHSENNEPIVSPAASLEELLPVSTDIENYKPEIIKNRSIRKRKTSSSSEEWSNNENRRKKMKNLHTRKRSPVINSHSSKSESTIQSSVNNATESQAYSAADYSSNNIESYHESMSEDDSSEHVKSKKKGSETKNSKAYSSSDSDGDWSLPPKRNKQDKIKIIKTRRDKSYKASHHEDPGTSSQSISKAVSTGSGKVSFGSSKGSMVETLIFESPVQEEPEPSPIAENPSPFPSDRDQTEAEREKVRVTFYQQSKPQEVDLPDEPIVFPDPDFMMATTVLTNNSTNHIVYNRTESVESGWENPFRPGGDLSREADEIVELIKGGKPITPTPGSTAPPLPSLDQTDKANNVGEPITQSPKKAGELNATPKSANGNVKDGKPTSPGPVDVKRGTVKPDGDASQIEHVTIKKKPKCKCCVIQ